MLERLFGKRDNGDESACAECGRTLLAGEWTQRFVDDDGSEHYICSLCAQPGGEGERKPENVQTTPVQGERARSQRSDSDTFWRALKDKDAEIERLEARLARAEAEKQELTAEIARLKGEPAPTPDATPAAPEATADATPAGDGAADELTDPSLGAAMRAAREAAVPATAPAAAADPPTPTPPAPPEAAVAPAAPPEATPAPTPSPAPPVPVAAAPGDDSETPLTILQRGVDLLNVSAVPRKIIETSESLGVPSVHVGAEDPSTLAVTFLWSMGWYRFRVELSDGGRVTLADRGYELRDDLPPNASVRDDGTVQLAPTFGKQPTPKDDSEAKPPVATSGDIIAKSMLGQRTDDEAVVTPWDQKKAPDFDWGR